MKIVALTNGYCKYVTARSVSSRSALGLKGDAHSMVGTVQIYQNSASNALLSEMVSIDHKEMLSQTLDQNFSEQAIMTMPSILKEDAVIALDILLSKILEVNRQQRKKEDWSSVFTIDLEDMAAKVYPMDAERASYRRKARCVYRRKMFYALMIVLYHGQQCGLFYDARPRGAGVRFSVSLSTLHDLQKAGRVSPIHTLSEIYRPSKQGNQWTFYANRALLLDRNMNSRPLEYEIPLDTLLRFLMLPSPRESPKDNRGWSRGRTFWEDHVLKPAIEGKGLFSLLSVDEEKVRLRVCSKQAELEASVSKQQKRRKG